MQDDLETLERHYRVRTRIGHGILHVLKVAAAVFQSDVVFCWFASVYGSIAVIIAQLAGAKSIMVLAGVDVSKEKEYGYGIWLSPWKSRLVRYALRHADKVLVVAPSLKDDAMRLAEYDGKNVLYFPSGHDSSYWKPAPFRAEGDSHTVLTVAVATERQTVIRKGLDTLIEAAVMLPGVKFTVVGTDAGLVEGYNPPANMTFHGKVPRKDLLPFYQGAQVYCQPSRREGLPNALCEAMLCGCIPVATDTSGNPAAVGAEGILVPVGDAEALAEALSKAFALPPDSVDRARARIVSLFPKDKHERELIRMIDELAQ